MKPHMFLTKIRMTKKGAMGNIFRSVNLKCESEESNTCPIQKRFKKTKPSLFSYKNARELRQSTLL